MKTYKTSEVAKIIGIHPNTVRFYEDMGLIPKPTRLPNGYRVFTELHIEHFRLAREAMKVEVLQNGLRKQAIEVVKTAAMQEYDKALKLTEIYIEKIQREKVQAEEAINIVEKQLEDKDEDNQCISLTRKEAADYLSITIDTLRNWELNGLITIKRKSNSYRIYEDSDIRRLKIIRTLRCANYSLEAILRLLNELSKHKEADIREVIDTPDEEEDIISVCDKLLTSLKAAEANAREVYKLLISIKEKYSLKPPL